MTDILRLVQFYFAMFYCSVTHFQLSHLIVVGLITYSECRNPAKVIRSFHSSIPVWKHNPFERFEMNKHEDNTVSIDSSRYPLARKDDSVVSDYHGIKVSTAKSAKIFANFFTT